MPWVIVSRPRRRKRRRERLIAWSAGGLGLLLLLGFWFALAHRLA